MIIETVKLDWRDRSFWQKLMFRKTFYKVVVDLEANPSKIPNHYFDGKWWDCE